jgi:hypothetical protein
MRQIETTVTYFATEGRTNLPECVRLSFEAALAHGVEKIVIFTVRGQGVAYALDNFCNKPEYEHIKIIAVTFPQGFGGTPEKPDPSIAFPKDQRDRLRSLDVPVIKAHMPFEPIQTQYNNRGLLAQDLSIVGNALNIFCGSMSLCIQGVLMACDAGEVYAGEPVVVLTSDTALIVQASTTSRFLTDLIVRQLICKPAFLTIGKREKGLHTAEDTPVGNIIEGSTSHQLLDAEIDDLSETDD